MEQNYKWKLMWIALSLTPGLYPHKLNKLAKEHEYNPELVIEALKLPQMKFQFPSLDKATKYLDDCQKNYRLITVTDSDYPSQLLDLDDPPTVLYIKGKADLSILSLGSCLAMVGSRQATSYGMGAALDLSGDIANKGLTVISGLAKGIDTCVHKGALETRGCTVAVLGCGIEACYPSENRKLSERICESGLLISEYPGATPPLAYNFPYRNRIIAALARAVIIVQASMKSGAMITMDIAANLGRTVMAVPGPINCLQSEGPLELLQNGAPPVRHSRDVFDNLGLVLLEDGITYTTRRSTADTNPGAVSSVSLNKLEKAILKSIAYNGTSTGALADLLQAPIGTLLASLNKLELCGFIRRLPNSLWIPRTISWLPRANLPPRAAT